MVKKKGNEYISLDDLQNELESYLRHSYKKIEINFGVLSEFLDSCGEIDQVIVMGNYSLGMDLPYYEKVLIPKYKFKKWLIYWHDDKDKEIADKFRGKYNLDIGTTQW